MIDLTPLEVRQKKGDFPRTVRGYNVDLVDDFLDLVADRLEELTRNNMKLTDDLGRLKGELEAFREREQGLTEALVAAQEARAQTERQAKKDAELVRREAEVEAERVRTAALEAQEHERTELRRLRARRLELVRRYREFLERELGELEVVRQTLEEEWDGSGAPGAGDAAAGPARTDEGGDGIETAAKPAAAAGSTPEPAPDAASGGADEAEPASDDEAPVPSAAEGPDAMADAGPASSAGGASSQGEDNGDWLSSILNEEK